MCKKRSWLCFIKTLFFPETLHHHHQHQQMCKRKKWLFARQKRGLALPLPPPPTQKTEAETGGKQGKCEEDDEKLISQFEKEVPKSSEIVAKDVTLQSIQQLENHVENLAATKIQTVYRGCLARKALRALKGFVKLQAIIRGRAVRRQAITTLKCLQAIVNIQSELCTRRVQMAQIKCRPLQLQDLRDEKPKAESNRHRRDDALLSKVDEIDIILRKKEAILRRQKIKAYSFNHRHCTESEGDKTEGSLRCWLEYNMNDQDLKLRNAGGLSNPHVMSLHRRSFQNHMKQNSYGEDGFPTYMAATESARAKTRSLSSPRVRPIHLDAYSDSDSPYKHRLSSPMSSTGSEVTCSGLSRISNKSSHCSNTLQQKSSSFKGHLGPVRSSRNPNVAS
ncbi:hypothetical protein Cgig2_027523 [Carnegiea gigantea]|uniref:DUF4005 domain-containing protein n=1 Tax=Carnegiea gigantea TaxID=171969 RepID=A0A9Q1GP85_9CARY|nr:hypothetical protein Cgig2_027523 [Carnegiea gigantea]